MLAPLTPAAPNGSCGGGLGASALQDPVYQASARGLVSTGPSEDIGAAQIGAISVAVPVDTAVVAVSARGRTPEAARRLADSWVKALAEQVSIVENTVADTAGPAAVEAPTQSIVSLIPVEAAGLPGAPISPKTDRNIALGAAVGLLLGIALAVVLSRLDQRLRSIDAIRRRDPEGQAR